MTWSTRLKLTGSKLINRLIRLLFLGRIWIRDHLFPTYEIKRGKIIPLLFENSIQNITSISAAVLALRKFYEEHYFDLLGTGWQVWDFSHDSDILNLANRKYSRYLRVLLKSDYHPIDWHLDIRSGYRWRASTWSRFILPARPSGVDIKIPWELSRMQHLPLLAVHDIAEMAAGMQSACLAAIEFQNQVLDFISTNPPRFGVNWRTPMDVAIRASNWVLTYNLCLAAGYKFTSEFDSIICASLRDHGRNIVQFMEWDPNWRANHYLANICGMIFIAAILPRDKEIDSWLAFAVQELVIETQRQVQEDGSVFEASTGYHRLSIEMIVYATAAVLGLIKREGYSRFAGYENTVSKFSKPLESAPLPSYPLPGSPEIETPFPEEHFRRLQLASVFTAAITKPNGCVPLIGDNDSGRFFRLDPAMKILSWQEAVNRYENLGNICMPGFTDSYIIENQLDFQYLVDAISGLVGDTPRNDLSSRSIDFLVVQALACNLNAHIIPKKRSGIVEISCLDTPPEKAKILKISINDSEVLESMCCEAFSDFGLYIFRSPRFFLSIRCGAIGQGGYGGHAHNDQLSIELSIDDEDLIKDPGVYRYTVSSEERRAYRSIQAHFAPRVGEMEPGNLDLGPWRLGDEAQARVEILGKYFFRGSHIGFGKRIYRQVTIQNDHIEVADWGDDGLEVDDPSILFNMLDKEGCLLPFCPGYGVRHL